MLQPAGRLPGGVVCAARYLGHGLAFDPLFEGVSTVNFATAPLRVLPRASIALQSRRAALGSGPANQCPASARAIIVLKRTGAPFWRLLSSAASMNAKISRVSWGSTGAMPD